jgi:iron complex outermembrane receptor protein
LFAQQGTINGTVATSDGKPAQFVTISLKGAGKGAIADSSGRYEIKHVKPGDYSIEASFVGLQTTTKKITVTANEAAVVDFVLQENANQIQEVLIRANPSKYLTDYPSVSLRLKTPLLEIPQNIQVVTAQTLKDQQIFDILEGVTRNVSGAAKMEHWDIYANIFMRGSRIPGFRNGMNVQSDFGPVAEDMSMVESIEFVKGPAGFMLANGEPSGFYNIVTKKPTGLTKGEASMTIGSFDTYRTTLDFDGQLSKDKKILYRLNLMGQFKGSHRDFEYNNRISVAPVLKFQFTPKTSLTAEYNYQFNQMSAIGSNYAFSPKKLGDLPVNFTTGEVNIKPTNINDHSLFLTLVHNINNNWKFTGQLAYVTFNQVGQSLWPTGFKGDTLLRAASIWDALGVMKVGQFFVNGDVKTGNIGHRLLVGVDMGDKDFYHDWSQSGPITGRAGFNVYNPVYGQVPASGYPKYDRSLDIRERGVYYNNNYSAVYVQDEIRLFAEKLRLTLAGRYTTVRDQNPYSGGTDAKKFTPRVGLSYSINNSTSAYAVFDQAFIPQAGASFNGKAFDPITGSNKEIGLKRDWLNGRWTATLAAYQIVKNNVLTADPQHQFFSIQLGQTKASGIEFDLRGELVDGLDVTANYAYNDAKVTKDTDETIVGKQIPGTAKNIANAWLNYRFSQGALKGLGVAIGVQYQNGRTNWYGAYDTEADYNMPVYTRLDAAITYRFDKFAVALNVNNLTNNYLYSGSYYTWTKFYYWQAEAMRNSRLAISYRF